ncbi:hypothetical protein ACLESO_02260 [Pyxidicoccus sp. 3LG]
MAIEAGGGCDSRGGCTSGNTSADTSREAAAAQAEAARAEAAKAEAAKAEAEKAAAEKAAAAAVTNSPAVQTAYGVSSFTPASAPPAGMRSLQSPSQAAQAKADFEKAMAAARERVQERDRVCYTPEALDKKAREQLASQPRIEPSRAGPSVAQQVKDVYDRVMNPWEAFKELFTWFDQTSRPNIQQPAPTRPTPTRAPRAGR